MAFAAESGFHALCGGDGTRRKRIHQSQWDRIRFDKSPSSLPGAGEASAHHRPQIPFSPLPIPNGRIVWSICCCSRRGIRGRLRDVPHRSTEWLLITTGPQAPRKKQPKPPQDLSQSLPEITRGVVLGSFSLVGGHGRVLGLRGFQYCDPQRVEAKPPHPLEGSPGPLGPPRSQRPAISGRLKNHVVKQKCELISLLWHPGTETLEILIL